MSIKYEKKLFLFTKNQKLLHFKDLFVKILGKTNFFLKIIDPFFLIDAIVIDKEWRKKLMTKKKLAGYMTASRRFFRITFFT